MIIYIINLFCSCCSWVWQCDIQWLRGHRRGCQIVQSNRTQGERERERERGCVILSETVWECECLWELERVWERERQIDKVFISFYFIHLFLLFLINVGFWHVLFLWDIPHWRSYPRLSGGPRVGKRQTQKFCPCFVFLFKYWYVNNYFLTLFFHFIFSFYFFILFFHFIFSFYFFILFFHFIFLFYFFVYLFFMCFILSI